MSIALKIVVTCAVTFLMGDWMFRAYGETKAGGLIQLVGILSVVVGALAAMYHVWVIA